MGEVVAGIALGPTILGWISPELQATLFPSDILPAFGVAANLGLVFYMFLVGLEIDVEPAAGQDQPGGGDLEHERRAADDARDRGRAPALPLFGPDKKFVAVRAVHGRRDVDHRLPGARADPGRAADAEAARGRADAGLRRVRRRDGLVPDRARLGRGDLAGTGGEVVRTIALAVVVLPGDGAGRAAAAGACVDAPTTRRGGCPGWLAAIFAGVLCRRSRPRRSGSR